MVVSCEICGKQFDSFRGLNGHRNAHIKRAESELCENCSGSGATIAGCTCGYMDYLKNAERGCSYPCPDCGTMMYQHNSNTGFGSYCSCFKCGSNYITRSRNAENWGGDPKGQLSKALANVRDKAKRYAPTPLRLTKLPHPDQKTLYDKYEADVIIGHSPYPDILGSTMGNWHRTSNFCWMCGDLYHHHSNCKSPQKYTDALTRKKDMLKSVNAAIKLYSSIQTPLSDSDVEDLKELRRMIKNNHFGIARHYFNSLDTAVRDNIGYETEISFEADEWKLLPRDSLGRWQKPVRSESINELRESLQTSVPAISELLNLYGGDNPNNRYKLYNDLQSLKIDAMDAALPDDTDMTLDNLDLSWMTPQEYYEYILEEPIDVPDDTEDDSTTFEFQERLVRYTAMTMLPQEVEHLIKENIAEITEDLFADNEEADSEINFLNAVRRYQKLSEQWSAE
jgi:hypothetical protein